MRRVAYAVFVFAAVLTLTAFALWAVAIILGVPAMGWVGALVVLLALIATLIGSGLVHTAQQREQQR